MKKMNKEVIKNIGIGILVIIAIILLITIICYNKISIGRLIPTVETYELSEEMKNELATEQADENSEIITTYELDASDLKSYEKTKEYNKGKKNPFAAEETSTNENSSNDTNTTQNNDTTVENTVSSSSSNFYEDDGTK